MANWAFVIGINTYHRLQSLSYAVQDAEKMCEFLKKAQFDRIFYFADNSPEIPALDGSPQSTQPTYANLYSFLVDFFEAPCLDDGDNFWFFFSGHGVRHEGRDYLMPCDVNPRAVERTAIPLNYVTERLRGCGADNVVLFLDACRNDGEKSGLGIGGEKQKGVITIWSCSPSEKSYEIEELGQGSFTYALLEALQIQGEGNCATVGQLCDHLRRRVNELNREHNKPPQIPYSIVEPETKYHYILLPNYIKPNESDITALREDAFEAAFRGDLVLAKQLLYRVWILEPSNSRIQSAYDEVIIRLAQQSASSNPQSPNPAPSSAGSKTTPVATPPKPSPLDVVELKSEKGEDYTQLRELLRAKKWWEADKETARLMLEVSGFAKEGLLNSKSIKKIPCVDLQTIDELWIKASGGRFGFSCQKRIYQEEKKNWACFGDRIGWKVNDNWLHYNDLTFDLSAPKGHLPIIYGVQGAQWTHRVGWAREAFSSLFSRVKACEIYKAYKSS